MDITEASDCFEKLALKGNPHLEISDFPALSNPIRRTWLIVHGGGRGIRTPVTVSRKAVFKTACFNRSHIPPREERGCHLDCTIGARTEASAFRSLPVERCDQWGSTLL